MGDKKQIVDNSEKILKCRNGKEIPIIKSVSEIEIHGEALLLETFIDITERKIMEASLRESEERFRGIVSSMNDIVYTLDAEQRHTGVYGNWLQTNTVPEKDFIGSTASEIFGPEIGKVHEAPTLQALAGQPVVYEWVLQDGDKKTYFQTSLSPMHNPSGNVCGVVGIGRDVSNIKHTEIELKKSYELYKRAQSLMNAGHYVLDIARQEFQGSEEAFRVYGYLGRTCVTFDEIVQRIASSDAGRVLSAFQSTIQKGTYFSEEFEIFPLNSNTPRIVRSNANLEQDEYGNPVVAGIVQDITEQKQNERYLRSVILQNKRILDNLQDAYFQADLDGYFTIVNPRAVQMYGFDSIDQMVGLPAQTLYVNTQERNTMLENLKKHGYITDYSCQSRKKDGMIFWVSMNVQYVRDDADTIIGTEGLVRDISERMKLEEELSSQKDSLEQSNRKLLERLQQSANAISKIGELRDVYTAGHQKRVQELACEIARCMGMSDEFIMNLYYGALIHDIGKIYVASDILNKPGKISTLEYQILQTHAEHGFNIVSEIDFPKEIPTMIHQHHERLDGSGYPLGLSGEQITKESRILGVADVVEAMTSHRPYRPALGIEAALAEIQLYRGIKFDAEVVDVCTSLFRDHDFHWN